MQALAFHNTQFDIVDHNGQPWLRLPQVGVALGYANPYKVQQVYDRNADEFTGEMTAVVELDTAGGRQQVRIFSLRGAHLLAMFARTKVAKEFRRWVLDVLEGIALAPANPKRKPKALPNGLTTDQQGALKALVAARIEDLPETARGRAARVCWSALKAKFGCGYKEIAPEQFTEAVSLVARIVLEGEWLGKEESKEGTFVLDEYAAQDLNSLIHYTDWVQHRWNKNIRAGLKALNPELYKNTWELFDEAARAAERLERRVPHIMAAFRSAMRPRDYLAQGMSV